MSSSTVRQIAYSPSFRIPRSFTLPIKLSVDTLEYPNTLKLSANPPECPNTPLLLTPSRKTSDFSVSFSEEGTRSYSKLSSLALKQATKKGCKGRE
ncbi:hypothetical protein R1flu_023042 [Riccia fluitans]|uniref:Uncharacterized protein n=1 Tax=Riccia fluitans TaxID=41844 RepID=A0ABD1XRE4_9MARC